MLDETYRLHSHIRVAPLSDTAVMITTEKDGQVIEHPLAAHLLRQLAEGPLQLSEYMTSEQNRLPLGQVMVILHQLEQGGFITKAPLCFSAEQEAYWRGVGYDAEQLAVQMAACPVDIQVLGSSKRNAWEKACEATGLTVEGTGKVGIIVTNSYRAPELADINRTFHAEKRPWLLVKSSGTEVWVGPIFHPEVGDSACWNCLRHRLELHDQKEKYFRAQNNTTGDLPRPHVAHPLAEQLTISLAVHALVEWMMKAEGSEIFNGLISYDVSNGQRQRHAVVQRPQCEVCGNPQLLLAAPAAPVLSTASELKTTQGGYRSVAPETTLAKYQHHVSPITGIAPYLDRYNPLPGSPVFNYGSGKNLALQSTSLFWLNMHQRSANGGKGKTEIQAKVGALCEAIERYSLMYQEERYSLKGNLHTIEHAIHPNDIMLFSNAQFASREVTNAAGYKFYALVPRIFQPNEAVDWTPVFSLTENRFKYLPSEFCYAQYPSDDDEKNLFSYPDSNGCAAGNTLEEAILQGYLELIERDAAAIWFYNQIPRPSVDISSAGNPYLEEVQAYYASIGRSLYVLDITTDLGVPVFVAITHRIEGEHDEILYAFGAHVDAKIALERAVVEVNQLLPIVKKKEGEFLTKDPEFIEWLSQVRLAEHPYLAPGEGGRKFPDDYPTLCAATISDAVQHCMSSTEKAGLETLLLDLTQPDVGLPVAKVMVPGLRHFWRRTAPGRLYEVPVKLGWLPQANTEEMLNSYSILI